MADGTRRRRHSPIAAKSCWYARHRSKRFARRFGGFMGHEPAALPTSHLAILLEIPTPVAVDARAEDFETPFARWDEAFDVAFDSAQRRLRDRIAVA